MEQSLLPLRKIHDNATISSILGISAVIVTIVFALLSLSIDIAVPHFHFEEGRIHFHGETSLLNLMGFFISASILVIIQNKLQKSENKELDNPTT